MITVFPNPPLTALYTANTPRLCSDTVWCALVDYLFPVRTHLDLASKLLAPKTVPNETPVAIPGPGSGPGIVDPFSLPPAQAFLAWPLGIPISLHFHLSTSEQAFALDSADADLPHFVWQNITFGDWNEVRTVDYNIHLPEVRELQFTCCFYDFKHVVKSVQRNGSLWAHIFITKDNADPNPSSAAHSEDSVHHVRKRTC